MQNLIKMKLIYVSIGHFLSKYTRVLFVLKAYIALETCFVEVGILLGGHSYQVRLFYDC